MATDVQSNPGPAPDSNFNPFFDREKRKQFIKERFEHARQWDLPQWEASHKTAELKFCGNLHSRGVGWVGANFFDYAVDFGAWTEYVRDRKLDIDEFCWPWTEDVIPKDLDQSGEGSQIFKAWLDAEAQSASTTNDPEGLEPKNTPTT